MTFLQFASAFGDADANLVGRAISRAAKAGPLNEGFQQNGVVSPNPRKFRHPNSSPATMTSRSMTCPSPRKV
jgi:hypothetical protein